MVLFPKDFVEKLAAKLTRSREEDQDAQHLQQLHLEAKSDFVGL